MKLFFNSLLPPPLSLCPSLSIDAQSFAPSNKGESESKSGLSGWTRCDAMPGLNKSRRVRPGPGCPPRRRRPSYTHLLEATSLFPFSYTRAAIIQDNSPHLESIRLASGGLLFRFILKVNITQMVGGLGQQIISSSWDSHLSRIPSSRKQIKVTRCGQLILR